MTGGAGSSDPSIVVALVTAPPDVARPLARLLVERRVAACANVVPAVWSTNRWQGEVEVAEEALLILKTTRAQVPPLDELLAEHHPYDAYELVILDVVDGAAAYLAWVADGVAPGPGA